MSGRLPPLTFPLAVHLSRGDDTSIFCAQLPIPVFATTATESSDLEMEVVGQMAGGENPCSSGSSSSGSYLYS